MRTAVDLFCGCGGISSGLHNADFHVLAGADNDPIALRTFQLNFPDAKAFAEDLSQSDPHNLGERIGLKRGELDLLAGGPPCQGFSKNVPRRLRLADDPNNQLVAAFLRFANALMPRFLLMENVAEMKNGFEQVYTNLIVEALECAGYKVNYRVLYAPDYGVPQRRRRAFFVASRDGERFPFPAPSHTAARDRQGLFEEASYVTVWEAIGDLPPLEHGEGSEFCEYAAPPNAFQVWARNGSSCVRNHLARHLQPTQYQRLAALEPGQGIKDLPEALRPKQGYSGAYGRLTKDMIAPTITRWVFHPGSGRFGHPVSPRVITIREAARLQAFPDTFVFTGTYIQQSHQVGNAVPPLLVEKIAGTLEN